MDYRITVKDENGLPVLTASVTFRNGLTGPVLTTLQVSATGTVVINDEFDSTLFAPGVLAIGSAPGYSQTSAPTLNLSGDTEFYIEKKSVLLPVLLVGGALLIAGGRRLRRKKSVGQPSAEQPRQSAGLSPATQTILAVGALGVVAYLLLEGKPPNKDLPNYAAQELANLAAQGMVPTISEAEAAGFSATIVAAADDCGTDEDAIWNVMLQLRNTADVLLLIKVYDTRKYKGCFDGDFFGYHDRNLAETLTSELSDTWIGNINLLFANRGINFKF